ncbi:VOC family protein [Mucilaginibacter ginsenosidivorax]|uniref:Glyoxalase/bleomycin resistance/extradiol dioxygenase family protein n=1 Tax=Mucilaginibacter ginsenosidivorax TaxID=862126 RepID=A0A5B8VVQ1_9SPHI|nr:VOC family protein [Mucilaginibacter ginsenosidivorax]QEC75499.1 glyoxalase/bleomycin resistance/extradiol dioxygenase family protein [Mucilaginibacter ginsenosidivorax]
MATQIFVNLPVKDLNKSIEFFTSLGYTFNPQFTNEVAASLVISDTIYFMLVTEPFFKTFTKKEIADATQVTETINCISLDSREAVDEMIAKAVAAGATTPNDKQDHGWMYGWGFQDLDGHLWEFAYMDMSHLPG